MKIFTVMRHSISPLCGGAFAVLQLVACAPIATQHAELAPGQVECTPPSVEPEPLAQSAVPNMHLNLNIGGQNIRLGNEPTPQELQQLRQAEARWRSPHPVSASCTGILTPVSNPIADIAGKTLVLRTAMSAGGNPLPPQIGPVYFSPNGTAFTADAPGSPWTVAGDTLCFGSRGSTQCAGLMTDNNGQSFIRNTNGFLVAVDAIRSGDSEGVRAAYAEAKQRQLAAKARALGFLAEILKAASEAPSAGGGGGGDNTRSIQQQQNADFANGMHANQMIQQQSNSSSAY